MKLMELFENVIITDDTDDSNIICENLRPIWVSDGNIVVRKYPHVLGKKQAHALSLKMQKLNRQVGE